METNFVNSVIRTLNTTGLAPQKLILEITDTAMIHHLENLNTIIQQLRNKGIQFCWDDWGLGDGSLNILQSLPWDKIKIHQNLIAQIDTHSKSYHFIASLIQFAQKFEITVIAKGVKRNNNSKSYKHLVVTKDKAFCWVNRFPQKTNRLFSRTIIIIELKTTLITKAVNSFRTHF